MSKLETPSPVQTPLRRFSLRNIWLFLPLSLMLLLLLVIYLRTASFESVLARYEQHGGLVRRCAMTPLSQALVWIRSTFQEIRGGNPIQPHEGGNDVQTLTGAPLSTDDLWILTRCTPILIELPRTPLSPKLITLLAKLDYPFHIKLPDSNATDQSLAQLCNALSTRQQNIGFELGHTTITSEGVKALKRIPKLVIIGLESPHIDGSTLQSLKSPNLAYLQLPGCNITDQDIPTLIRDFKVPLLDLSRTKVTAQGIAQLVNSKSFAELHLDDLPVTDELLATLTTSGTSRFSLARTQITDAGLTAFARCARLSSLNLSGTKITNAGLKKLPLHGPNTLYFNLELAHTSLDDSSLPHLLKMSPFGELDLSGTKFTDRLLQTLAAQKRSPVQVLYIKRTNTSLSAIQALKKAHPRLRIVSDFGVF